MQSYDPESGLVFTETVVRAVQDKFVQRLKAGLGRGAKPRYKAPRHGAQSLGDIALRKTLCNLEALDCDCLKALPQVWLDKLWQEILRHELDGVEIWKRFANVKSCARPLLKTWNVGNALALDDCMARAQSHSCVWLVDLLVGNIKSAVDLVNIAKLTNLRHLHIYGKLNGSGLLSDGITKTWSDMVHQEKGFAKLEMLFLRDQDRVTAWSLEKFSMFPSLRVFGICACGIGKKDISKARQLGWKAQPRDTGFHEYAELTLYDPTAPIMYTEAGWSMVVAGFFRHRGFAADTDLDLVPVLTLCMGPDFNRPRWPASRAEPKVVCFERDPASARSNMSSTRHHWTGNGNPESGNLRTKKRKLRDGKSIDVGDMLSGL